MRSTLPYCILFCTFGGELFKRLQAFLKNADLKLPVRTLKATNAAFQADAVLHTVIAILVRRFLHQEVKRHRAICLVHFFINLFNQPTISINSDLILKGNPAKYLKAVTMYKP